MRDHHHRPIPSTPRFAAWLLAISTCFMVLGTPAARAQEAEAIARSHFQLGRAYYEAGNFDKAAAEFEAAYQVSKRPELLYNVYLAYRDANDMANAARALEIYLEKMSIIENRAQLEARLDIMKRDLAAQQAEPAATAQPQPAQPAQPEPAQPAQPVEPEPQPTAPAPAVDDRDLGAAGEVSSDDALPILPIALMAGGGAMVVGSLVTGLMASSAQSDLEEGCETRVNCGADLEDTKSQGETLAVVTDVLLFGGLAVAGTGVALFLLDMDGESDSPRAGLACVPGACHGSLKLHF